MPPGDWSFDAGDMAVELAESVGVHLYPWQQFAVRMIFAEGAAGHWAAFAAWIVVARQNGKGEILMVVELAALFLFGEKLILHSAHEFATAKDSFRRIRDVIDGSRDLSRKVAAIRTANGDVGIELRSGQRLRFIARTRGGGRGMTVDRLVLDEGQQLPEAAISALLPTLSTRPNPQIVGAATVPDPVNDSEHLEGVRMRAMAGGDPGLTYMGWTQDVDHSELDELDLDDHGLWAAANPSLGWRIPVEMVTSQRQSLSDEMFRREILSVWPAGSVAGAINVDRWSELVGTEHTRPSPVALGVTVSEDRSWSTIGLAGRRQDGDVQVQVVQTGKGTGWVASRVAELVNAHDPVAVVVDPTQPEGSLVTALIVQGVVVTEVSGRKVEQACARFGDAVKEGTVHHSAQTVLTVAVEGATKHRNGATWIYADGQNVDVSPLRSVVSAMYGLDAVSGSQKKRTGKVW